MIQLTVNIFDRVSDLQSEIELTYTDLDGCLLFPHAALNWYSIYMNLEGCLDYESMFK